MYIPDFIYLFIHEQTSGMFPPLAIVNDAVMNIGVAVSVLIGEWFLNRKVHLINLCP